MRHGLKGTKLPDGAKHIENSCNKLRRQLEDAVGETGVYEAALINSAMRHERRAQLAERWLVLNWDDLPLQERLALTKTTADASDSRDKCIQRLGIDRRQADVWDHLGNAPPARLDHEKPGATHSGDVASGDANQDDDKTSQYEHPAG